MDKPIEAILATDDSSYTHFIEAATLLDPAWTEYAACANLESTDFFPLNPGHHDPTLLVAKTCQACPVRKECFDTIAVMEGGRWESSQGQRGKGFFAGLNPSARSAIYRQPKEQWFELATRKLDVFIVMREAMDMRKAKRQANVGKPKGRKRKDAN